MGTLEIYSGNMEESTESSLYIHIYKYILDTFIYICKKEQRPPSIPPLCVAGIEGFVLAVVETARDVFPIPPLRFLSIIIGLYWNASSLYGKTTNHTFTYKHIHVYIYIGNTN